MDHPDTRFEAFIARSLVGGWTGDFEDSEHFQQKALAVAQESGRADLETKAIEAIAMSRLHRLDVEEARPLVDRALELADQRAAACSPGHRPSASGCTTRSATSSTRPRRPRKEALELYREMDNRVGVASMLKSLGRIAHAATSQPPNRCTATGSRS